MAISFVVADPPVERDDPPLQTRQLVEDSRRCFRIVAAIRCGALQ